MKSYTQTACDTKSLLETEPRALWNRGSLLQARYPQTAPLPLRKINKFQGALLIESSLILEEGSRASASAQPGSSPRPLCSGQELRQMMVLSHKPGHQDVRGREGLGLEFGTGSFSGQHRGAHCSPRPVSFAKAIGTPETLSREGPSKPKTGRMLAEKWGRGGEPRAGCLLPPLEPPSQALPGLRADPGKRKQLCTQPSPALLGQQHAGISAPQRWSAHTRGVSTKYQTHHIGTTSVIFLINDQLSTVLPLSFGRHFYIYGFHWPREVGQVRATIPTRRLRQRRLREGKQLAQNHTRSGRTGLTTSPEVFFPLYSALCCLPTNITEHCAPRKLRLS